jgi:hypothetical protein
MRIIKTSKIPWLNSKLAPIKRKSTNNTFSIKITFKKQEKRLKLKKNFKNKKFFRID